MKLLLVEDSDADAYLFTESIEESNFTCEIIRVSTVAEAKDELNENSVDIVCLDLSLPDSTDKTPYQFIRFYANIPFVILTGLDDEDLANNLINHGAQDYILKGEYASARIVKSLSFAMERHKLMKEVEHFAFVASHDLRNPINNIKLLVEFIRKEGEFNDKAIEMLDKIELSADRMTTTLLSLNDVISHKSEKESEKVEITIDEELNRILESLESLLKETNTKVEVQGNQAIKVEFPKAHFLSIIQNLITNGIKYKSLERDPVIVIEVNELEDSIEICVQDNGCGIDLERHGDKLFGLFNRFHTHVSGKGIGLYLVKSSMEKNGGQIKVDSVVEEGTTFTLNFKK